MANPSKDIPAVKRLLSDGYAVIPEFLAPAELAAARDNFLRYFPSAEELARTPERFGGILEDPENLQVEFPFAGDALNAISIHPRIVALVEQLLGTRKILLSQSAIWAKYGGTGDFSQGLHCDYQGNSLVYPRDDGDYRQVNLILYYSDVTADLGPTYIVPNRWSRNIPRWPAFRTRKDDPALYRHEKPILAAAGALLLFGMSTFHRASDLSTPGTARFSHHMVYRAAAHGFQGYHHWPRHGENPELQRFITHTTPRQRELLGFPEIGDPYWNKETIAGVARRYPQMDMTPYRTKKTHHARRNTARNPPTG
jgi:Phytanoyl-CoA dioxygenase (PhyH)